MFSSSQFSRLARVIFNRNTLRTLRISPVATSQIVSKKYLLPTTIGFSIFTWLGFKEKTPEDELIENVKYCVLYIQRGQFPKAEQLLHVTLRQAQQLHHDLAITYIYDVMANLAFQRNELEKAKKLFVSVSQRLLADGVKEDDPRIVHISLKLARISHLSNQHDNAQCGFEWCFKKMQDNVDNENQDRIILMALAEDWYGRLLSDMNKPSDGVKLMIQSLERIEALPDKDELQIVFQLNDIGTVYEKINDLDNSISYLKMAIDRGKALEDFDDFGALYINLGRVYLKKHMYDEARKACGFGWRLGVDRKNLEVKNEAVLCIQEVNNAV